MTRGLTSASAVLTISIPSTFSGQMAGRKILRAARRIGLWSCKGGAAENEGVRGYVGRTMMSDIPKGLPAEPGEASAHSLSPSPPQPLTPSPSHVRFRAFFPVLGMAVTLMWAGWYLWRLHTT